VRWGLQLAVLSANPTSAADLPPLLLHAGFSLEQPEPEAARQGAYDKTDLTIFSPGLAFWVDVARLQGGDHLVLSLKGPDGGFMAQRDIPFDLARDRTFAFASAKRPGRGWQSGAYTGTVQVIRGDQIVIEQAKQIALP
jgi:hypothetical protein